MDVSKTVIIDGLDGLISFLEKNSDQEIIAAKQLIICLLKKIRGGVR